MSSAPVPSAQGQAADWFAKRRISGLSRGEREAFEEWLAAPGHLDAYEAVERAWAGSGGVADDPRVAGMRQAALERTGRRRRWLAPAAAAAALLVAAPGGLWWAYEAGLIPSHQFQTRAFRTGVGERSTITLPDGSQVTLNTDTVLRTEAAKGRRQIHLDKGQAFFRVARDAAHPFVVTAGGRTVTALGTAFDVRVDDQRFEVTLVEGKVRVEAPVPERAADPKTAPRAPARVQSTDMVAGTQLIAADAGWKLDEVDARRETSWTTGQLNFLRQPLGEVVAELNRYSTEPIVIEDSRLAEIPVSGTFKPGDNEGFAAAVVSYGMAKVLPGPGRGIRLVYSGADVKKSPPPA